MKVKIINSSGFSILLAIGVTGILLLIVSSLAISYIRESRLSRFSYDEVLASTAAEGMFEYGMLKIRNHTEGFQDSVTTADPDGEIIKLITPRSVGLQSRYTITASSIDHTFTIPSGQHLIVPLFVSNETLITPGGIQSKNPAYNTGTINSSNLSISGIGVGSWTIVGMEGNKSIAITGSGDINPATSGITQTQANQCYDKDGNLGTHPMDLDSFGNCTGVYSESVGGETIAYSYDTVDTIGNFLTNKKNPYFIMQNATITDASLQVTAGSPFSLPNTTLTTTAKKGDSSQVFRFTEDRGKYYDVLKYGVYNTGP